MLKITIKQTVLPKVEVDKACAAAITRGNRLKHLSAK